MALISCPECKKQVSSRALECPECAFPLDQEARETGEVKNFAAVGVVGGILGSIVVAFIASIIVGMSHGEEAAIGTFLGVSAVGVGVSFYFTIGGA